MNMTRKPLQKRPSVGPVPKYSIAGTTVYSIDAAGRRTRLTTPSAAFDFGYCGWNGRLAAVTNASGFVVQYAHDIMDRVTNISWQTASGATLGGFAYEYDALGRITSRSHSLGTPSHPSPMSQSSQKTYAYDDFDRLANVSSGTNLFAYSYLLGSDLVSGYTCGGFSRTVEYEPYRDLVSAITNRFGSRVISTFEYANDAAGRRTAIFRGGDAMGPLSGATDAYGYNGRNEVVSARRTLGGSPVAGFDEDFAYDPIGNRISSTDYDETGAARISTYAANNLNQYTSRTVPGWASVRGLADADATVAVNGNPAYMVGRAVPSAPNPDDLAYFFGSDDFDNSTGGGFAELEVSATKSDGTNDLVSVVTNKVFVPPANEAYAYDADGNMTEDARFRYYWNGENRMIRAEEKSAPSGRQPYVIAYAYDHMGRNVIKNGAKFVWDDYNIIVENAASSNAAFNTWGLDLDGTIQGAGGVGGLLAVEKGAAAYLPAYDANGNVTEYVTVDGAVAAHYAYSAFGKQMMAEDAIGFSHRFSTKPYCAKTGLVEFEFRKYAPGRGRWLRHDIVQLQNLYAYIQNSCFSLVEFLGLYGIKLAYGGAFNFRPLVPFDSGLPFSPAWVNDTSWSDELPDCPCSIPIGFDGCPEPAGAGEGWTSPGLTGHKGGSWEIRSEPNYLGAGQQCVYDAVGKLINEDSGAGTPDRFAPSGFFGTLRHIFFDVAPYHVDNLLQGSEVAEMNDHARHPPNKGKDGDGNPCPPNDGLLAPPNECIRQRCSKYMN